MKITANVRDANGEVLRTVEVDLPIPATSTSDFDTYFGGAINVREGHLDQTIVKVQARVRGMAAKGADKKGHKYTQGDFDAAALEVIEGIRKGPREKVAKVDKVAKVAATMTRDEVARAIAQLQAQLANE